MTHIVPDDSRTHGTVFIIDDDEITKQAVAEVAQMIGLSLEWYANAESFFEHYDPQKPGCLILEVHMLATCGLDLHQEFKSHQWPPIIFITTDLAVPLVFEALNASGRHLVRKPLNRESLLNHIQEAIALDHDRRRTLALANDNLKRIGALTKREYQIMKLLATGESSKQIAHSLSISPKTVENHRAKILEKMGADNPTQITCMLAQIEEHENWQN